MVFRQIDGHGWGILSVILEQKRNQKKDAYHSNLLHKEVAQKE